MEIVNDKGRRFLVRVVKFGDRYGLDDCLTHKEADPLIEFYDREAPPAFGGRGQFVSHYYARTLAKHNPERGLCLDGANADAWGVDARALAPVLRLAREITNDLK